MRWSASFAMFRCGVSVPSAVLIACLCANDALSQTPDVSTLQTLAANPNLLEAGQAGSDFDRHPPDRSDVSQPDRDRSDRAEHSTIDWKPPSSERKNQAQTGTELAKWEGAKRGESLTANPLPLPTSDLHPPESFSKTVEFDVKTVEFDRAPGTSWGSVPSAVERPPSVAPEHTKVEAASILQFPTPDLLETCTQVNCHRLAQVPPNLPDDRPDRTPLPEILPGNVQPDPNRDRFLQPTPEPSPEPPQVPPTVEPSPTPSPLPELPTTPIAVRKIEVKGSTILSSAEIEAIIKPLEGRTSNLQELRQAADKITEIYLDRGYITSRAVLPPQTITNGTIQILVIEGRLARIDVEGAKRLNPSYIRSRVRLGAGTPLSTAKLEDQLRLLRVDPLFDNVEASLRAGEKEGESILIVRVTEANPFQASFGIDNYSPPSVGSERLGGTVRHRNLTGRGDELAASYYRALGDSDVFDFSYRIPVNAMNGTLQLRAAPNRNGIVQEPFKAFNITGKSHLFEISYRQPLVRSPVQEFALSLGFTYQRGRTFLDGDGFPFGIGPGEEETSEAGITTTSVIKLGQDYIRRDPRGAWALRSQFSIGTGLFDATINDAPIPDSLFFSWLGQVQRVQRLNDTHLLIIQADLQLSANSLLPSQQFVMGGGQSLRGYRQNVRSGDNGFRFSVEDRITIERDTSGAPILQLAPFFDVGSVWNSENNPNKLINQTFLAGIGLGVLWEPIPKVNIRLDYGIPLVNISDRGSNAQDSGFYFSVIYSP